MSLHASAARELLDWDPPTARQRELRDAFVRHLDTHADGVWRSCVPAHITASAAVVDPTRRLVLLVLHRKVGRWLQPGGHCEPGDVSLAAAALREATEESGIHDLQIGRGILQVDRHPAPCRPGVVEEHLDVRYLLTAPPDTSPTVSAESEAARWFGWDALPVGIEPTIIEMVDLARDRSGA